jgi:hypothetical protein
MASSCGVIHHKSFSHSFHRRTGWSHCQVSNITTNSAAGGKHPSYCYRVFITSSVRCQMLRHVLHEAVPSQIGRNSNNDTDTHFPNSCLVLEQPACILAPPDTYFALDRHLLRRFPQVGRQRLQRPSHRQTSRKKSTLVADNELSTLIDSVACSLRHLPPCWCRGCG